MADHIRSELVLDALQMALWNRRPAPGAIHHSDHGSTYTGWAFGHRLRESALLGSIGPIGDCFDHSVAERFFATLQTELLDRSSWPTGEGLTRSVAALRARWRGNPALVGRAGGGHAAFGERIDACTLKRQGRVALRRLPPMGTLPPSDQLATHELGRILRESRANAGMSLSALAAASGVSAGLLSQIERGNGNPSYNTLIKLAHALGVRVGDFFGGQDPEPKLAGLVRKDSRRRLLLSEHEMVYELITPSMNGRLGMIRAQVASGWSNAAVPFLHEGEECVLVVDGSLVVVVGGERYDLSEGDSLTYDASVPHWYANESDRTAAFVGAMTPPSY
jgi:transcriptional regulator with XRE-family HTH domain